MVREWIEFDMWFDIQPSEDLYNLRRGFQRHNESEQTERGNSDGRKHPDGRNPFGGNPQPGEIGQEGGHPGIRRAGRILLPRGNHAPGRSGGNYVKRPDARNTWLESHFRWQIRTFWFGLLWALLGLPIGFLTLGMGTWFVYPALLVWLAYRTAKGWLRLTDGQEMYVNPRRK